MGPTFVSYFVISQGVGSHHRCCLPPQDRRGDRGTVILPKQNDTFHTKLSFCLGKTTAPLSDGRSCCGKQHLVK